MIIHDYREHWIDDFNKIKRVIEKSLQGLNISIEHIGSTSVPSLAAKPIIDIDIVFAGSMAFEEIRIRLEKLGYFHNGNQGIPDREAFKRNVMDQKHNVLDCIDHHLYVCPVDSAELQRHILFRNYLTANEDARVLYQNLKLAIALEAEQDRKKYVELKEVRARELIYTMVEKARKDKKNGL